ncbi:MAG TPA: autotransporter domain-containing protein [Chthoniobacterales bacterium]|nr:autotransporter domain-containing protein [Chthoniobacterales bacterium]
MKSNPLRNAIAICAAALAFSSVTIFAQTTIWTDATGNWFTAGNWDNGLPNAATDAEINNGGTAQIAAAGATAKNVSLGQNLGSAGTLTISGAGSTLTNSGTLSVGSSGAGTLHIQNGGSVSSVTGEISEFAGSAGHATVDGAGSTWNTSASLFIGDRSDGDLAITNGGVVNTTLKGIIGGSANGTVNVDGSGSKWLMGDELFVGNLGHGTLTITGGGLVMDVTGRIARSNGSTGHATVDGVGSMWTNSGLFVGDGGHGILDITNGGQVSSMLVFIGFDSGSSGVATVDGVGSKWTNTGDFVVGNLDQGTLAITNGGGVSNVDGLIGDHSGSNGTVIVNGAGSTWTNSGNLYVGGGSGGPGGTGLLRILNGGTVSASTTTVWSSGTLEIGVNPVLTTGTLTFDGGTLRTIANTTFTNNATLAAGGVRVDSLGFTSTLSGIFSGTGGFFKFGTGTIILTNANTYTGITNVNVGSLIINGSTTSDTFVDGLLGGTGTIFANVSNGGIVSPGDSGPGTFHITGTYIQSSTGTLRIEIGGLAQGTQSDLLAVGGSASLNGTLQLIRINNFRPLPGDRVTIITDQGGHTGMFSNLDLVNWGLIQPVPMYNEPTDVYVVFELASTFQSQGETPNQRAVGHAIDQAFSDQCLASNVLGVLGSIPAPDLPRVFDLIAPEEFAAMYEISFSRAVVQSENLQRRMDQIRDNADPNCGPIVENNPPIQEGKNVVSKNVASPAPAPPPDNRWGTFAMGSGDYVTVHNQDENADGYKIANGSFLAGVDYRLLHNLAIGVYGGYVGSESDLVGHGRIITDGGTVGGYATFFSHGFYLQAAGGGGWNSYENLRAAFLGVAHSSTNGSEVNAMGAIGYDWSMNFNAANHPGSLTVGPIASVQYTNVNIDGFHETGSLIPLEFPGQSEDSLRSTIGGKLAICIQTDHGIMLRPEARVAWLHEYNDRSYPINARFIGCDDLFTVRGPRIGGDAAQVTGGLTVQFNPMVALFAHYEGIFGRDNYDSNGVSGGLAISF